MKNIRRSILLFIAGGILMPFVPLPTHGWARKLYREIQRDILSSSSQKITEEQIRNSLYHLKADKYIKQVPIKKSGRMVGFHFELTKGGKKLLRRHTLDNLRIPKQKRWDLKWRFLIFDVPEKNRDIRKALRNILHKTGFFRVQYSVWVHPYPCQKETDLICEFLGLQKYVLLFEAKIKNDWQLQKHFRKRGFALT